MLPYSVSISSFLGGRGGHNTFRGRVGRGKPCYVLLMSRGVWRESSRTPKLPPPPKFMYCTPLPTPTKTHMHHHPKKKERKEKEQGSVMQQTVM